jgi:glycosyltransferase involved in cell wall biosynthesis
MGARISVVCAVYNPGPYLQGLIDSLERQTMPAGDWEAVFVDDGSTDGSGERLDEIAAGQDHLRVVHIPNSGWPGRPRNVGLDAATGTYVVIVDHDDWLGAEALERMVDRAERNEADVVMAKEVGHGFGVPLVAFRENVDDARLGVAPLQALLTPHKLFRRSMLDEHGIRFPEGKRRLEDHQFVMHAYFHARRISILADYPCYHWTLRGDRSNATHSRVDWSGYYENLGEILDIVDAHTEPGPLRDRLYGHWYFAKTLHKLRGKRWYDGPLSTGSASLVDAVEGIVADRFPPRLDPALTVRYRVVARAVRARSLPLVSAQAELTDGIGATFELIEAAPRDWGIDLAIACALATADGTPLTFVKRGGRLLWSPPEPLASDPSLRPEDLDATDELGDASVEVVLRHRASRVEYSRAVPLPLDRTAGSTRVEGTVRISLDLATWAAGTPLSNGTWDVLARVEAAGWRGTRHLPVVELDPAPREWSTRPYVNKSGNLSIEVAGSTGPMLEAPVHVVLPPAPARVVVPDSRAGRVRRALRRVVPISARSAARRLAERVEGSIRARFG